MGARQLVEAATRKYAEQRAFTSESQRLAEKLTADDKEELNKLFKKFVRDGELDDYTTKSVQGALTQLFKVLYQRRGNWKGEISLKQV